ncbi:MAG: hypothetical protein J6T74_04815 [Clostridia bacterium]|nr:hypothetical protein [Clostridia bacterium]
MYGDYIFGYFNHSLDESKILGENKFYGNMSVEALSKIYESLKQKKEDYKKLIELLEHSNEKSVGFFDVLQKFIKFYEPIIEPIVHDEARAFLGETEPTRIDVQVKGGFVLLECNIKNKIVGASVYTTSKLANKFNGKTISYKRLRKLEAKSKLFIEKYNFFEYLIPTIVSLKGEVATIDYLTAEDFHNFCETGDNSKLVKHGDLMNMLKALIYNDRSLFFVKLEYKKRFIPAYKGALKKLKEAIIKSADSDSEKFMAESLSFEKREEQHKKNQEGYKNLQKQVINSNKGSRCK